MVGEGREKHESKTCTDAVKATKDLSKNLIFSAYHASRVLAASSLGMIRVSYLASWS